MAPSWGHALTIARNEALSPMTIIESRLSTGSEDFVRNRDGMLEPAELLEPGNPQEEPAAKGSPEKRP